MKYAALDIETLGLNTGAIAGTKPDVVLSIGLVLDDLNNQKPVKELPSLYLLLDPGTWQLSGNLTAICMGADELRMIQEAKTKKYAPVEFYTGITHVPGIPWFTTPQLSGKIIKEFLMDNGYGRENKYGVLTGVTAAGKNAASFDIPLLYNYCGLHEWVRFDHRTIDPAILYYMPGDDSLPGLGLCKQRAGLPESVAHHALSDAMDIVRLLRIAMARPTVVDDKHTEWVDIVECVNPNT